MQKTKNWWDHNNLFSMLEDFPLLNPNVPNTERLEETKDQYVFYEELPGYETPTVELTGRKLTIKSKRLDTVEEFGVGYPGSRPTEYVKTITFPTAIDQKSITAKFKNGVFVVKISKAETEKPALISVKVE